MNVIDGNGNASRFDRDVYDRVSHLWFPNPAATGQVSYSDYEAYYYDADSRRTAVRRRDGRNIISNYDALGRVTSKVYPNGGATGVYYSYDLRGLQLSARFASQSGEGIANAFDGFGRLRSTAINLGGTARTLSSLYDRDSNRTRIAYPDATDPAGRAFDYAYDGLGRPVDLSADGGPIVHADYAIAGGIAALARRNPAGGATIAASAFVYDSVQRPSELSHALAGSNVHWTYGRNAAGGLATVARDNDAFAWTGHYAVNRPYAVNGLNQYTSAGGATFAYDALGNLTGDGADGYGYDIENRLVTVVGAHNATLAYDPLGRLYQVTGASGTTTTFLYDGDALVAEYNGATLLRRHIHSVGADVPVVTYEGTDLAAPRHLFADERGSIVARADGSGALANLNTYDEYGIPGATNSGRFQYTGQIWIPELGMYYYKARVYSPTLGRFLQTDPIGYADRFNLYGYVGDDPINRTDPTGLWTCAAHSAPQCRAIAGALREARTALTHMRGSEGGRLRASLRAWGQRGVNNHVVVQAAVMRDVAQTSTRDGITTVSVNSEIGSLAALQAASMGSAAGTAAHEGTHIDDERNRLGGRDPRTRQEWYDTERRAFRLQGQVDRALGAASRGGYPLWLPSWGRGVEERNMEAGAHDNAWMTACGSGCESVNPW